MWSDGSRKKFNVLQNRVIDLETLNEKYFKEIVYLRKENKNLKNKLTLTDQLLNKLSGHFKEEKTND